MKLYYSLTEAAEMLGYANGVVLRNMIRNKQIRAIKIGNNWVMHYEEIKKRQKFIKEHGRLKKD